MLCLVHCAALPILVVAFPLLGWFHGESSHLWLTLMAIPTAFLALFPAYRSHGRILVPLSGFIGLNLLVGAELYGHFLGHGSETLLSLTGAALLIGAHWVNLQLQRPSCR